MEEFKTGVKEIKAPNLFERGKEEIEAIIQTEKKRRDRRRDSYGNGTEINEDTPISEVKAPNVFERAKEEIEALVGAIHPIRREEEEEEEKYKSKSNSEQGSSSGGGGGFWSFLGSFLEKSCSPLNWTKK